MFNIKEAEVMYVFPSGRELLTDDFMMTFVHKYNVKNLDKILWAIFEEGDEEAWKRFNI